MLGLSMATATGKLVSELLEGKGTAHPCMAVFTPAVLIPRPQSPPSPPVS